MTTILRCIAVATLLLLGGCQVLGLFMAEGLPPPGNYEGRPFVVEIYDEQGQAHSVVAIEIKSGNVPRSFGGARDALLVDPEFRTVDASWLDGRKAIGVNNAQLGWVQILTPDGSQKASRVRERAVTITPILKAAVPLEGG